MPAPSVHVRVISGVQPAGISASACAPSPVVLASGLSPLGLLPLQARRDRTVATRTFIGSEYMHIVGEAAQCLLRDRAHGMLPPCPSSATSSCSRSVRLGTRS